MLNKKDDKRMQGWPLPNISSKELVQCEMNVISNQENVDLLYTSCYP